MRNVPALMFAALIAAFRRCNAEVIERDSYAIARMGAPAFWQPSFFSRAYVATPTIFEMGRVPLGRGGGKTRAAVRRSRQLRGKR